MSAAWTLISNSLKDYKKEISHILHKHIDNLTFDTDETKEEFSLLCCKLLKESVRKLTEVLVRSSRQITRRRQLKTLVVCLTNSFTA